MLFTLDLKVSWDIGNKFKMHYNLQNILIIKKKIIQILQYNQYWNNCFKEFKLQLPI